MQGQIRVLTQRKVELAAAEEAAKASPEDQKEVHAMAALQHVYTYSWHGADVPVMRSIASVSVDGA